MKTRRQKTAYEMLPGNMGGETLREYCGLSRRRDVRSRKAEKRVGISAQLLVIAVRRHQERADGEQQADNSKKGDR